MVWYDASRLHEKKKHFKKIIKKGIRLHWFVNKFNSIQIDINYILYDYA